MDPRKTIKAPYSKGNVVVFGQNAGQQFMCINIPQYEWNRQFHRIETNNTYWM